MPGKQHAVAQVWRNPIEILILLVSFILPIMAFFLVIYVAVRLAIRHEHRNHEDR